MAEGLLEFVRASQQDQRRRRFLYSSKRRRAVTKCVTENPLFIAFDLPQRRKKNLSQSTFKLPGVFNRIPRPRLRLKPSLANRLPRPLANPERSV
ncbi:MAG TPA: hypothetical protein VGG44_00760, partial [Tepidisphaeraceae bacterium]